MISFHENTHPHSETVFSLKFLRQWLQDVAKAEKQARVPEVISVSLPAVPGATDGCSFLDEPVTLFIPGEDPNVLPAFSVNRCLPSSSPC